MPTMLSLAVTAMRYSVAIIDWRREELPNWTQKQGKC